jgi:molybdopterin-guanine dinucleotide biosynthesis protein A
MQVLCARYSVDFVIRATEAFGAGERSLTRLVRNIDTELFDVEAWKPDAVECFEDVDTSEDLERMVRLGFLRG